METRTVRRALGGLVLAVALLIGLTAVPAGAGQGSGNPVLTVSPASLGTGGGTVTVSGGDYLVPPHAPGANVFGGVYLFFGWVRPGAWGPSIRSSSSNDGNFGVTYSYAGDGGDGSTRDDGSGRMRLVSFTPGGDSGTATPFHMDDNGNWSTTLAIPGSTYQFVDPASGRPVTVNCRLVQCGVLTVGAHGKASATNERFAPISFTGGAPLPPSTGAPGPGGGSVTPAGDGGGDAPDAAPSPGVAPGARSRRRRR